MTRDERIIAAAKPERAFEVSSADLVSRQPPRRILLDAGALDLTQGTGVSTYARGLEAGLKANGCQVERLFGRAIPKSHDDAADTLSFFSSPTPPGGRLGRRLYALSTWRKAHLAAERRATTVNLRDVVLDGREAMPETIHNVSRLHEIALLRHRLTRRFTTVRLKERFDAYHLSYPWPIRVRGAKQVVTIHDLIPLRLPYSTLDIPEEIVARLRTAARLADLVVTVSEASRSDLKSLLGVPDEKIAVTYQAAALARLTRDEMRDLPARLARFGLLQGDYLLFVGAVEPKKNLRRLIEAFALSKVDIPLVLAGPDGWMVEQELAPLRAGRPLNVIRTGFVPVADLRALYAGARAFVFPSLYEGFGLPLLEALSFGLPALTSSTSALPEVGGEAALYVDPFDGRALREGLEALAGDAALRGRLSAAAQRQAASFSTARYHERLADAYRRLDPARTS